MDFLIGLAAFACLAHVILFGLVLIWVGVRWLVRGEGSTHCPDCGNEWESES